MPEIVINAAVLGSVAVGKTTLLASMYKGFQDIVGSVELDIRPTYDTSRDFQVIINKLQQLPRSVKVKAAVDGTTEVTQYRFGVGRTGREPAFTLQFTDYSGKYLTESFFESSDEVSRALVESDVVLVAIDTPALMERNGKYHNAVNRPDQVRDKIIELVGQSEESRLVILTLLKSETYLETPQATQELIDKVKLKYDSLLKYIGRESIRGRVGCVLAAVKTVGPIMCYDVDESDPHGPQFLFSATKNNAAYAPEDTDQPLRYLLQFVINKYRSARRPVWRIPLEVINRLDHQFIAAVDTFAAGCKDGGSVVVLQDHKLLHTPRPWPGGGFHR